jgi:lipopolysaccharide export system permease protein
VRIIDRYIWKEFQQQFLICGLGFLVLGIGKIFFDYNDFFIGYHITTGLLVKLLLNQIPSLLMDIIPAASLFGAILAIGRLLRENELDAIRICGPSIFRIMSPVFVGLFLICIGAYWWNDLIVPSANYRFQNEIRRLSMKESMPLFKEKVVFKGPQDRFVYLDHVDRVNKKITGILIFEANKSGKWPRIITADHGNLHNGFWQLYNGTIHEIDKQGAVNSEVSFQNMEIRMTTDFNVLVGADKSPSEMRAKELKHLIGVYRKSGLHLPIYTVFYYQKYADPMISVILVFLATPLSMVTGRHSRWLGMVYCFLIIMGYYTMQVIGRTMGSNGLISPWIAAWVPHIVFLVLGIGLLGIVEQKK